MTPVTAQPLPSTVVGYIRVSTESQDTKVDGLERQAEKIREFCQDHGLICVLSMRMWVQLYQTEIRRNAAD